jgi:hypothetical protein
MSNRLPPRWEWLGGCPFPSPTRIPAGPPPGPRGPPALLVTAWPPPRPQRAGRRPRSRHGRRASLRLPSAPPRAHPGIPHTLRAPSGSAVPPSGNSAPLGPAKPPPLSPPRSSARRTRASRPGLRPRPRPAVGRGRRRTRPPPHTAGTAHGRHRTRPAPPTAGTAHGRHRTRPAPPTAGTAHGRRRARPAPPWAAPRAARRTPVPRAGRWGGSLLLGRAPWGRLVCPRAGGAAGGLGWCGLVSIGGWGSGGGGGGRPCR